MNGNLIIVPTEGGMFSEPAGYYHLRKLQLFAKRRGKKSIYLMPMTGKGLHRHRWIKIPLKAVPGLIAALKELKK